MSGWCPSASASCATSLMKRIDSMKLLNLKLRVIFVASSSFHLDTMGSSPLMVYRSKGCVPTSHGTQCFAVRREASVVPSLLILTPFQSCVVVSLKVIGNCGTTPGQGALESRGDEFLYLSFCTKVLKNSFFGHESSVGLLERGSASVASLKVKISVQGYGFLIRAVLQARCFATYSCRRGLLAE